MSAYAIGHLTAVTFGEDIVRYLERIDETLAPFEGRFRVHGARADCVEGDWSGDLIIIEFPDMTRARAWYRSEEYTEIRPLRTRNSAGTVLLIDGVADDHRATDILAGVAA
ncbi:DUF1330 domain-containing protein [Nisaea sediminum]|uniref:DUF1330 domain-containing protein n=1 Tax=Nisaea sediminum TaxID=2775867 RepID=UPI001865EFB4|nr:DUF1330 domain-containing protein [Nisaea sediminum]